MREMWTKDYFEVVLSKVRVIGRVQAVSRGHRYPQKYSLYVLSKPDGEWEKVDTFKGPIDVSFDKPKRIAGVKFEVVEPMTGHEGPDGRPPAWSIYDVRLTEIRLFGKWWGHVI